jgi:subtilisin family serine protease
MKKIFFTTKTGNGYKPFWEPWGAGFFGRFLLFLVLLFLFLLGLALFHRCSDSDSMTREDIPDEILNPPTDPDDLVPIDTTSNDPFPGDIDDPGPYLPEPDDNVIPPYDDDDLIDDDDSHQIKVGDRLNVILDSKADDSTFKQFASEFKKLYPSSDYEITFYDKNTKLMQLRVPADKREEVKKNLPKQITDISFKIFDDSVFGSQYKPNDKAFKNAKISWYFQPIQMYDAWDITRGSDKITVAVVDSYFDINHPELNSRIVKPYSVRFRSSDVRPAQDCPRYDPLHPDMIYAPYEHGSMVASQALGAIDNGAGAAGIAPNCKLMPVSLGHEMTTMSILQGLLYSIYNGADVVNLSLGAAFSDTAYLVPIDDQVAISQNEELDAEDVWNFVFNLADERHVTIVWAAGNEKLFSAMDSSKRGKNTIRVSAVDEKLCPAVFTNYGNIAKYNIKQSTISAPGCNILGACPYNTFDIGDGTSFASPIITGVVALMKSLDSSLTNPEIIKILQETGKPVKPNSKVYANNKIGPLVQVADALKRVGGSYTKMQDVLDDHSKLQGIWKTTETLYVVDSNTGDPTGEKTHVTFNFNSKGDGGTVTYTKTNGSKYSAPVKVQWGNGSFTINMTTVASDSHGSPGFVKDTYHCRADKKGLLTCNHSSNTGNEYYLKKIK